MVRAAVCACRCCLWCLERCLQFITEYAYVPALHARCVKPSIYGNNLC